MADNLQMQEAGFAKLHKSDTDEELIAYLVKCSKEIADAPKKRMLSDTPT